MMIKKITLLLLFITLYTGSYAQNGNYISLKTAKFITGDQPAWKDKAFDDSSWKTIKVGSVWQEQGYADYHGFAWYRIHVTIPSSLKNNASWGDSLRVYLAHVNDADETFLNGKLIGKTGALPADKGGYQSKWPAIRNYHVAASDAAIKWDRENILAIKVYDGGGSGGIFMGEPFVDMLEKFDGIRFNQSVVSFPSKSIAKRSLLLHNAFNTTVMGVFHYQVIDEVTGKMIQEKSVAAALKPFEDKAYHLSFPHREGIKLVYDFTEKVSKKVASFTAISPYILTPAAGLKPMINGPALLGVHPGSPVIYKIPVSGARPIKYAVKGLPEGLSVNSETGLISGRIATAGNYTLTLSAANNLGRDQKKFKIQAGDQLVLTPPMGWNSWNCWGLNVSEDKVKSSASAMLKKGLANYGWNYINVDDGWQAAKRADNGEILANEKFNDMTALGNYLHGQGLKFGIYSSPGERTCGGFPGSFGHEAQDCKTYFNWGVDYLKYDLCSYSDNIARDTTLAAQQKPYILMGNEIKKYPRDLVYSICQYGIHEVWKWGAQMNGQLWRTTEDITDTWESLSGIGFSQTNNAAYAGPGGWNDPDMLILGMVGWGENLHPTDLTPYEQYTHMSLWSLLSAPLLIGCDMDKLDEFTLSLLKNREVIAIDQDELGKQALKTITAGHIQVWVKPLADGSKAIGIFNLGNSYQKYTLQLKEAGIKKAGTIRDVWQQKDIAAGVNTVSFNIPPHGVRLLKI